MGDRSSLQVSLGQAQVPAQKSAQRHCSGFCLGLPKERFRIPLLKMTLRSRRAATSESIRWAVICVHTLSRRRASIQACRSPSGNLVLDCLSEQLSFGRKLIRFTATRYAPIQSVPFGYFMNDQNRPLKYLFSPISRWTTVRFCNGRPSGSACGMSQGLRVLVLVQSCRTKTWNVGAPIDVPSVNAAAAASLGARARD